jgi:Sulfotransferase family
MHRFIVGTGRCGSTMLSNMLRCHPGVLSFAEFFSTLDRDGVFKEGEFTGAEAVELLSRSNLLNDLVTEREPYFADGAPHKYGREVTEAARQATRMPALQLLMSQFSSAPAGLYNDLVSSLRTLPRQALKNHYLQLFDWLTRRLGKQVWIERSGVSIEFLDILHLWYPQARFVHLHRDGPTTALSMRAFRHFVLYASFFFDPPTAEELAQALRHPIDPATDPILRRMIRAVPSLTDIGHYWSWQIARGQRSALALSRDQYLEIRYEDLVSDTRSTLRRLAEFFELPSDDGWLDAAAQQVDPEIVRDRVVDLDPSERQALEQACLPGQVLLGRSQDNPFEIAMTTLRAVYESNRS